LCKSYESVCFCRSIPSVFCLRQNPAPLTKGSLQSVNFRFVVLWYLCATHDSHPQKRYRASMRRFRNCRYELKKAPTDSCRCLEIQYDALTCQQLCGHNAFRIAYTYNQLIGCNIRVIQLRGNGHKCNPVRGNGLVNGQNVRTYVCKNRQ